MVLKMNKNILIVLSLLVFVIGVIQGLTYFTGNALAISEAYASFVFSYAMGIQVQVYQLREKIAKLSL